MVEKGQEGGTEDPRGAGSGCRRELDLRAQVSFLFSLAFSCFMGMFVFKSDHVIMLNIHGG